MRKKTDVEWVVELIEKTLVWLAVAVVLGGIVYAAL